MLHSERAGGAESEGGGLVPGGRGGGGHVDGHEGDNHAGGHEGGDRAHGHDGETGQRSEAPQRKDLLRSPQTSWILTWKASAWQENVGFIGAAVEGIFYSLLIIQALHNHLALLLIDFLFCNW